MAIIASGIRGVGMAKKATERQRRYDDAHIKAVYLKLNKTYDADIIEKLEAVGNKQGYIKELIRKDMHE